MNEKSPERLALMSQFEEFLSKMVLIKHWRAESTIRNKKHCQIGLFILEIINLNPGVSAKDLVKVLKLQFSSVADHLSILEKERLIEARRGNVRPEPLFLTPFGKERLGSIRAELSANSSTVLIDGLLETADKMGEENVSKLREALQILMMQQENVFQEMLHREPVPRFL